eukprot:9030491-Lingulodinium_polyedra.AAC.1
MEEVRLRGLGRTANKQTALRKQPLGNQTTATNATAQTTVKNKPEHEGREERDDRHIGVE